MKFAKVVPLDSNASTFSFPDIICVAFFKENIYRLVSIYPSFFILFLVVFFSVYLSLLPVWFFLNFEVVGFSQSSSIRTLHVRIFSSSYVEHEGRKENEAG